MGTPKQEEQFTDWEIGQNAARELAARAEEVAEAARHLTSDNPAKLSMMEAAAAALVAATPFLDKKSKQRFTT